MSRQGIYYDAGEMNNTSRSEFSNLVMDMCGIDLSTEEINNDFDV